MEAIENIAFDYDKDADVLHVSFGSAEPTFMREISDGVLLAIGLFSRTVVGLRVIGARSLGVEAITQTLLGAQEKSRKRFLGLSAAASRQADQIVLLDKAEEFLEKHKAELLDVTAPLFAAS